jgi:hypothetical protein
MIFVMLGTSLFASAPASPQGVILTLPPRHQQIITAKLGGIVGNPLPSAPIDELSVYFPLKEEAAIY